MAVHNRLEHLDEETPLLQARSKTPLPWNQINIIFLALVTDPISSGYIFPFINQLVGELGITGGDDRKIGYYAGLIESLFFFAQALTAWQWSRLSDFVGRRPIILIGLLGLSVSNFAFGLSRTLGALIISRCIAGILNGVGVMKSMVGDITDHTNMGQVFAMLPAIFSTGITLAPLYGGALVKPQEQWPHIFRAQFWKTYPYFLPSLVSGCFTLLTFMICAAFMKESLPSKSKSRSQPERLEIESSHDDRPTANNEQPVPMFTLLGTSSVMLPIVNYGMLALLDIGFVALLPLFCSSPIEIGGLELPPSIIGTYLATFGLVNGIVQALYAPMIIERFDSKKLFYWAILWLYPRILVFPIMDTIITVQGKVGPVIWVLLLLQLIFAVLMSLSFSVINIIVTQASPNKQTLGTTNGLCQSLTAMARAIGPALITTSFAVSKEYNILGGNLVYIILLMLTTILVFLSRRLVVG